MFQLPNKGLPHQIRQIVVAQMEIFELTKFDFIELNKLLKITQLASSGGEASRLISEGHVTVNGAVETQKRKKLKAGDKVELGGEVIEVR